MSPLPSLSVLRGGIFSSYTVRGLFFIGTFGGFILHSGNHLYKRPERKNKTLKERRISRLVPSSTTRVYFMTNYKPKIYRMSRRLIRVFFTSYQMSVSGRLRRPLGVTPESRVLLQCYSKSLWTFYPSLIRCVSVPPPWSEVTGCPQMHLLLGF